MLITVAGVSFTVTDCPRTSGLPKPFLGPCVIGEDHGTRDGGDAVQNWAAMRGEMGCNHLMA